MPNKTNLHQNNKMKNILLIILISLYSISYSYAQDYDAKELCDIIYIIEGEERARQPFGIETIECKTYERCEQICHNTINNNKIRFKNQTKEKDYLTFLAKRYCPPNWEVWLKNLKWYLKKGKQNG
jgi:hypothetical protein